jgi:signal transduction histidine kinase
MHSQIEKKVISGYTTALVLLIISFFLVFYINIQVEKETKEVLHSTNLVRQIERVVSIVKDGETGMRGFAAVKDSIFLAPFYESEKLLPSRLTTLKSDLGKSVEQLRKFDSLNDFIIQKYKAMNYARVAFLRDGFFVTDTLKSLAYLSKNFMDSLRDVATNMKTLENQYLTKGNKEMEAFRYGLNFINITTLIIAMIIIVYTAVAYRNENAKKLSYRKELESKVEDLRIVNDELTNLKQIEKFASTGRIARTIAHEVRNPLTNIILAADQLKQGNDNNESTEFYFDMINRNADRINVLLSTLLNATKSIDLKKSIISANKLLEDTLLLAADRATLVDIKISKYFTNKTVNLLVDIEQIKIAILNIIVNAIEAVTHTNGEISLTTKLVGNRCVIEIADNGTGISKENITKLFEPYYTSKQKGNGLGLTNAQNIVMNHGGLLTVESTEGKGTTFIIALNVSS